MQFEDPLIDPKTDKPMTDQQLKGLAALGDKLIELDEERAKKDTSSGTQKDS